MDFEEQLEKAEKLPTPSLVGSSIRSADDSPHNNYIHPEKSKGNKKEKRHKQSILNQTIAASLDDLMREGALLGSEEDLEELLDDTGNVKEDARYLGEGDKDRKKSPLRSVAAESGAISGTTDESGESEKLKKTEKSGEQKVDQKKSADSKVKQKSKSDETTVDKTEKTSISTDETTKSSKVLGDSASFYAQDDYSTPNLSKYQLDHQIKDHKDLLTNIQSHYPQHLPSSQTDYSCEGDSDFKRPVSSSKKINAVPTDMFTDDVTIAAGATDGSHTPYFQRDSRSISRSDTSREDRSRSISAVAPHLARGDSYKNTNLNEQSAYELPPELAASEFKGEDEEAEDEEAEDEEAEDEEAEEEDADEEAEEEDADEAQDRRSRQSKPTMGESIAAAEASKDTLSETKVISAAAMQRDTSLVTTGDYTNFDVDKPEPHMDDSSNLYSRRSASSTNYLRSISRSRSRQSDKDLRASNLYNEKNDADPEELARSGALITDDPYSTIGGLDTMVEEVLNPVSDKPELGKKANRKSRLSAVTDDEEKSEMKSDDITTEDDASNSIELLKNIESKIAVDTKKSIESSSKSESKTIVGDMAFTKHEKKSNDVVDATAIEQIESSLEPKDSCLDNAESLTPKDLHGDSTDINTKLADSFITDDKKMISGEKRNDVDDAAIDQIESGIDSADPITKKAESLTVDDIHATTATNIDDSINDKNKTNKTEDKKADDVAIEKVEPGADRNTENSYASDDIIKPKDKNAEEDNPTNETNKANKTIDEEVDDASIEKIESSEDPKDAVTENAELLKSKGINAPSEYSATDDSNIIDNDIENANKYEVEDKDTTGVKGSGKLDSVDSKGSENVTSSDTKPESDSTKVDDSFANDEKIDKKGVDEKTIEETESSIDSKDTVTDNAKSLTSEDITAESSSDSKSAIVTETKDGEIRLSIDKKSEISKESEAKGAKDEPTAKDINVTSIAPTVSAAVAGATATTITTAETTTTATADDDLSDIDVSPEELRKHLESQPVYIFTSLAGGMQIMTRTNRLTTILTANGIKFEYRDLGTDEEAKKIWRRQANGKTLPGVVRGDDYIGNWQEVDDANEEYRLREIIYETL